MYIFLFTLTCQQGYPPDTDKRLHRQKPCMVQFLRPKLQLLVRSTCNLQYIFYLFFTTRLALTSPQKGSEKY